MEWNVAIVMSQQCCCWQILVPTTILSNSLCTSVVSYSMVHIMTDAKITNNINTFVEKWFHSHNQNLKNNIWHKYLVKWLTNRKYRLHTGVKYAEKWLYVVIITQLCRVTISNLNWLISGNHSSFLHSLTIFDVFPKHLVILNENKYFINVLKRC